MFYVYVENNQIIGSGEAKLLNKDILSVEVNEEIYNDIKRYMWNGEAIVINPDYKEDNSERIAELKQLLADTDYVVIKIAEGVATAEEYADVIANRQAWRQEINQLTEVKIDEPDSID